MSNVYKLDDYRKRADTKEHAKPDKNKTKKLNKEKGEKQDD